MAGYAVVVCPACGAVVAEIMSGAIRVKCGNCSRRVWVVSNGEAHRIGIVDETPARLAR